MLFIRLSKPELSADLEFSYPLQEVFSIPSNVAGETYFWSF